MKKNKIFIILTRILYTTIFLGSLVAHIVSAICCYNPELQHIRELNGKIASYSLAVVLLSAILVVGSYICKLKEYEYDDIKIAVYAGWYKHLLYVNGKLKSNRLSKCGTEDEQTNYISDRHSIRVNFTCMNKLTVWVDGNLVEPI